MRTSVALSFLSAAVLTAPTLAFKDTSPLLLWASDPSQAFEVAAKALAGSGLVDANEVYDKISSLGCDWETVVLVHVDELHDSRLSELSFPSHDAHLHIPYLVKPNRRSLDTRVDEWAETCGAEVVTSFNEAKGKSLIKLETTADGAMPTLPSDLASPHLVLVTGYRSSHTYEKKQERPFPTHITSSTTHHRTRTATSTSSRTSLSASSATSTSTASSRPHHNSTIPTGGPLLERVQLLTTPIITSLLITFGLFLPIAAFGVSALAGIQVPPRMMEIGKGLVVDKGRKDQ
ncbi:hypothetical protein IAR55_003918 [Kwoniella newhampshirensis]|uniref:Protein BIG1 n=1 Tax=Kwoniella newhampshirensis TaxID=1651941 RepID=A0AAW0YLB1_9TREE